MKKRGSLRRNMFARAGACMMAAVMLAVSVPVYAGEEEVVLEDGMAQEEFALEEEIVLGEESVPGEETVPGEKIAISEESIVEEIPAEEADPDQGIISEGEEYTELEDLFAYGSEWDGSLEDEEEDIASGFVDGDLFNSHEGSFYSWTLEWDYTLRIDGYGDLFVPDETDLKEEPDPDNVETDTDWWGEYLDDIEYVVVEDGITILGDKIFSGMEKMEYVSLPASIEEIGAEAFSNCGKLGECTLPEEKLKVIGEGAFQFCTSLKSISIPESVEDLGASVFWGCANLKSASINAPLTVLNHDLFYNCSSLTDVELPDTVETICEFAFQACLDLPSIVLPSALQTMEQQVFEECTKLQSVFFTSRNVDYSFEDVFANCGSLVALYGYNGDAWATDAANAGKKVYMYDVPDHYGVYLTSTSFSYDGSAKTPGISVTFGELNLTQGDDYSFTYRDNVNAGTGYVVLTGAAPFEGLSREVPFTITGSSAPPAVTPVVPAAMSIANASVTVNGGALVYDGALKMPGVTAVYGSETLYPGTDYSITYANNLNAGMASFTLTGLGRFAGTSYTGYFNIQKAPGILTAPNISVARKKSTVIPVVTNGGGLTFKTSNKKIATVNAAGKVKGVNYGRAKITITSADNGNVAGAAIVITVDVTPSGTTIKGVGSPKRGQLSIKWKKNKTAQGYELQVSNSLDFVKGTKSFTIKGISRVSVVMGGLAKGKKYYIRMRGFRKAGGKTVKGPWSKVKSINVKK